MLGTELRHSLSDVWYAGERSGDDAGVSVSGLGDIDDDGRTEFAIGAPKNDENGADSGAVYIMTDPALSGSRQDALAESSIQFYGAAERDRLGRTPVHSADLNNDSIMDLIVSSS